MTLLLWVLQGLLALVCLLSGWGKAFRPLTVTTQRYAWAKHVPGTLTHFIGISELLGGVGLILPALTGILPWLTVAAAAGFALLMFCAAVMHVRLREFRSIGVNMVLLGLAVVIVVGRLVWG